MGINVTPLTFKGFALKSNVFMNIAVLNVVKATA